VNGYVKSWDHDIGSSVKAGQVLATIDAPDLDQAAGSSEGHFGQRKGQSSNCIADRQPEQHPAAKKQIVAQQLAGPGPPPTRRRKRRSSTPTKANVRQLEAMQSFKTLAAPL